MKTIKPARVRGYNFPVFLVLAVTAVALTATPKLESKLALYQSQKLAEAIDPGSLQYVQGDSSAIVGINVLSAVPAERIKPVQ